MNGNQRKQQKWTKQPIIKVSPLKTMNGNRIRSNYCVINIIIIIQYYLIISLREGERDRTQKAFTFNYA